MNISEEKTKDRDVKVIIKAPNFTHYRCESNNKSTQFHALQV